MKSGPSPFPLQLAPSLKDPKHDRGPILAIMPKKTGPADTATQ